MYTNERLEVAFIDVENVIYLIFSAIIISVAKTAVTNGLLMEKDV
jgi:hypothetical protein